MAAPVFEARAAVPQAHAAPKYYFQLQPVKAGPEVDAELKAFTGEALKTELAARPEWASDIGPSGAAAPGTDRTTLVAELKRRNLRGFDVTARIEKLKQEVKDPKPGARNKQLAVEVQLTVFGTTIPDAKLAFSGDGQSGTEAARCRFAKSPIPLPQVCGTNSRYAASAMAATLRSWKIPSERSASGWRMS